MDKCSNEFRDYLEARGYRKGRGFRQSHTIGGSSNHEDVAHINEAAWSDSDNALAEGLRIAQAFEAAKRNCEAWLHQNRDVDEKLSAVLTNSAKANMHYEDLVKQLNDVRNELYTERAVNIELRDVHEKLRAELRKARATIAQYETATEAEFAGKKELDALRHKNARLVAHMHSVALAMRVNARRLDDATK